MSSISLNRILTIPRLAVAFLIVLALYLIRDTWAPTDLSFSHPLNPPTQPPTSPESQTKTNDPDIAKSHAESCQDVPGADKVFIVLKTGATEIYEKLPTHFVTLFKCTPHYMIFSDLKQDYADYPIHDALATVSRPFRDHHEDFELYRKLEQYQREGQDMGKLKGGGGWNLDKWKFLPMMFQSFEAAPEEIEWFLLMEADTSVSWTNLLQWLKTMDSNKPYYLGAQNVIGDTTFAHGGSGVVLSREAARRMQHVRDESGREAYDERWESLTSKSCCGDEIIARALLEAGVEMSMAWPLIQGETVATIDWTEKHWCTPPVTWHHAAPSEVDTLWQFQSEWVDERGWDTPYLFRDVFARFIERHIAVNRTSWNNLSKDRKIVSPGLANEEDLDFYSLKDFEQKAVESQEACAEACVKAGEEFKQWMWSPGRCYLGEDIRFGKSDEREQDHWTSGWDGGRVDAFKKSLKSCKVNWSG